MYVIGVEGEVVELAVEDGKGMVRGVQGGEGDIEATLRNTWLNNVQSFEEFSFEMMKDILQNEKKTRENESLPSVSSDGDIYAMYGVDDTEICSLSTLA